VEVEAGNKPILCINVPHGIVQEPDDAGHLRTSEFLANAALFQCAVLRFHHGFCRSKWLRQDNFPVLFVLKGICELRQTDKN
jgi:hypothetical protein